MTAFLVENTHDTFSNIKVFYPKFNVELKPHLCGNI